VKKEQKPHKAETNLLNTPANGEDETTSLLKAQSSLLKARLRHCAYQSFLAAQPSLAWESLLRKRVPHPSTTPPDIKHLVRHQASASKKRVQKEQKPLRAKTEPPQSSKLTAQSSFAICPFFTLLPIHQFDVFTLFFHFFPIMCNFTVQRSYT